MAAWYLFRQKLPMTVERLYDFKMNAEINRFDEYSAAVRIQSWYRGVRLRTYLKNVHYYATIIQKYWRGFVGRRFYRVVLELAMDSMYQHRFNTCATLIQSLWKGYYIRKYTFDYHKYRQYLLELEDTNQKTLDFLSQYRQSSEKDEKLKNESEKFRQMKLWASNHHHLLSTKVQPGIYNSPFNSTHLPKEYLLKEIQKGRLLSDQNKLNLSVGGYLYDPACYVINEKPLPKKHLPPLPAFYPQGPFRKPTEVQKQRYRPLNPTLRVMTDFECVEKGRIVAKSEEWVKRLHDDIFYPVINRDPPYQPLLMASDPYSLSAYGEAFLRKENSYKFSTNFKTVVPPIQNFDKLNKQYIENYSL